MIENETNAARRNSIRSYACRCGQLSPTQQAFWDLYWPAYALTKISDLTHTQVLEIGFGDGTSLLHMAKKNPETQYIGIDVYLPGMYQVLTTLVQDNITNIRLMRADAVLALEQFFPDQSLDRIHIFFPDPWPKQRHQKRRLIQIPFITRLSEKLKPRGILHLATDWEPYAQHMQKVMDHCEMFQKINTAHDRPLTKYEKRGLRLGHQTQDLLFQSKARMASDSG
jgi:tRNA (guanine-N7-)-methyltransferase